MKNLFVLAIAIFSLSLNAMADSTDVILKNKAKTVVQNVFKYQNVDLNKMRVSTHYNTDSTISYYSVLYSYKIKDLAGDYISKIHVIQFSSSMKYTENYDFDEQTKKIFKQIDNFINQ